MLWLLVLVGAMWWGTCEFIRGRPSVSGTLSNALMVVGPLGGVAAVVAAILLKR